MKASDIAKTPIYKHNVPPRWPAVEISYSTETPIHAEMCIETIVRKKGVDGLFYLTLVREWYRFSDRGLDDPDYYRVLSQFLTRFNASVMMCLLLGAPDPAIKTIDGNSIFSLDPDQTENTTL